MSTAHVPLERDQALPRPVAHVQGYLERHDPELRLRGSVEASGFYVLERRVRRRPSCHRLAAPEKTDLQVQWRDGYIHVSLVHATYLTRPWNIIRALKEAGGDLFEQSVDQFLGDVDYEQTWQKVSRRRRRQGLFRDIAAEHHDLLARREGTRVSNAGTGQ